MLGSFISPILNTVIQNGYLNEIGELGISVDNQPMNLQTKSKEISNPNSWNQEKQIIKERQKKNSNKDEFYLEFDLVLLGFLERNVILRQPSLALPVLQQYEPDLPNSQKGKQNGKNY